MKRPCVSVTGASGFIGWRLCEVFRDAGWEVRGIVRPAAGRSVPDGVARVESPLEAEAVANAVDACGTVVHAAGLTRARTERSLTAANLAGTEAVVRAANLAGARLVFVSSQAAAGTGTVDRPRTESDAPRPLTPYGRSKLAAESAVRDHARVPWIILRPASVYGPRDRQFLPLFRFAARGLFPLAARPGASYTLIHVDDVAQGILCAAVAPASGSVVFLGHSRPCRADELLALVGEAVRRPYRPFRVPAAAMAFLAVTGAVAWRLGRRPLLDAARVAELRAEGFVCSVDRARSLLGFDANVPLREGLAATARWYEGAGWLRAGVSRRPYAPRASG